MHRALRQVERQQWLSRDEIAALGWERQKSLVRHAYEHSRFYRRKYDAAGFHPDDLQDADDFARIPVLTKDEVRENIADIVCSGVSQKRLVPEYTGGSTGVPLMVYRDANAAHFGYAIYLRTIHAWGLEVGCKIAYIWHRSNVKYDFTRRSRWHRYIKNRVMLDAADMSKSKMARFVELLRSFKPDLIIGYPSSTAVFAGFLDERGRAGFRPKAVWLTSEVAADFQKESIERVFQSTVYDVYGSMEIPDYAAECRERDGLHINADLRTLEIVDERGTRLTTGRMGQVVVTDLVNYAAPLIRYRNEDVASLLDRTCPCGRGLPLMGKVTGRIYDMFVLPDGSQVYGNRFTHFFYDHVDEVRCFQVHQTRTDRVTVRVVPTATCKPEALKAQIIQAFTSYTGGQVQFDVSFVKEIEKETSGKFRFVKSDISKMREFRAGSVFQA